VSCVPPSSSSPPSRFDVDDDGKNECFVIASVIGSDLVAEVRYRCDVSLMKVHLSARLDVASGVFEFGQSMRYVECGSSVTERFLMPPGVLVASPSVYVSAEFREGDVRCDSREL
jgi:hypothetical protein